jgi:hypothetical protein
MEVLRRTEAATDVAGSGLPVERDLYFRPDRPLSAYVRDAISADRIVC